jgi:hypothetical protein
MPRTLGGGQFSPFFTALSALVECILSSVHWAMVTYPCKSAATGVFSYPHLFFPHHSKLRIRNRATIQRFEGVATALSSTERIHEASRGVRCGIRNSSSDLWSSVACESQIFPQISNQMRPKEQIRAILFHHARS